MAKPTIRQVQDQVGQLLRLAPIKDWCSSLEKEVKRGMSELELKEVSVKGLGRVFITETERTTVTPELARKILGDLAPKVIEVKEVVSNDLIKALVQMGDITSEQREQLLAEAEKKPTVSLYIRPLK